MVLDSDMAFGALLSSLDQSNATFLEILMNCCSKLNHLEGYAWSCLNLRGYLATKIGN